MDTRPDNDTRRVLLARRLLRHQARTQTVSSLTGLSHSRLATLRLRWQVQGAGRRRGPSPMAVAPLMRNPTARSECAALISIWIHQASDRPEGVIAQRGGSLSGLAAGERLCDAYETFQDWFSPNSIDFEQCFMLVSSTIAGSLIRIEGCERCHCLVLSDSMSTAAAICSLCRIQSRQRGRTVTRRRETKSHPVPTSALQCSQDRPVEKEQHHHRPGESGHEACRELRGNAGIVEQDRHQTGQ